MQKEREEQKKKNVKVRGSSWFGGLSRGIYRDQLTKVPLGLNKGNQGSIVQVCFEWGQLLELNRFVLTTSILITILIHKPVAVRNAIYQYAIYLNEKYI